MTWDDVLDAINADWDEILFVWRVEVECFEQEYAYPTTDEWSAR